MKKSVIFTALLLCVVLVLPSYGRTHTFEYDSSVSVARNRAAEYAYEILNYEWYTNEDILRYNGSSYSSGKTTGTIHGVPYNVSGGYSFTDYVALSLSKKEETNGKRMKYGMVCASLVTDCIRQGFSQNKPPLDHQCLFHKRYGWDGKVTSIQGRGERLWDYFPDDYDAGVAEWGRVWNSQFEAKVIANDYDAYKKLRRGDYLENYEHVMLVIDNDTNTQTITLIEQTTCRDISESDRVGTWIRDASYDELAQDKKHYRYVPMYVDYPDDAPSGIKISDTFPDPLFREYVSNWDTNHDGYFSDAEIEAVTDFGWHAGPHADNNPHNWSPVGVLANNGERWKNIRSIEGVKIFTNLEYLYIYNDSITGTVDISDMKNLKDFRCYGNTITQINASGCSAMERLECQNNFDLTSLNINGCSKLEYINASGCKLSSLGVNINNTPGLKYLNCSNNRLAELSLSLMDKLEELDCSYNRLTLLYIASASSLKKVICSSNVQLSYLYLHVCPKLEEIYCRNTSLTKIYIPGQSRKNLRILDRDSKLDVSAFLPNITSWNLPSTAAVGKDYNGYIKAEGAGVIYYSQNPTAIANGIRIDEDTGKISGTPVTARSGITLKFTAQNFAGSDTKSVTVSITGKSSSAPEITTSSINRLVKGTYYYPYSSSYYPNRAINASGGTTPMTWSVYSGKLPSGMSLSTSVNRTVYLVGKPTSTGRYSFTLKIRDKNGLSSTKRFTVVVQAGNVFTSSSAEIVDADTEQETEIAED